MSRSFALLAACTAVLFSAAATAAETPQTKTSAKARPAAHATPVVANESVNPAQLEIATRVLTGDAQCEFNQTVAVQPVDGRPGVFRVSFKNVHYTMVPQETTTGAVRLEDKRAGVVWIQIPSKSMLLNGKIGQRMVDSCTVRAQRT